MSARRWLLILLAALVLLLMALPALAQEQSYIVQPGDSIQSIAANFGVSSDALLVRNGIIDPNRIRSGDVLIIPGNVITPPTSHIVQAGESLTDIAIRYSTTVEALMQANDLAAGVSIFAGQVIKLPAQGGAVVYGRTYVVDRGDTLKTIADKFGTTWQALAAANNLTDPNRIWAGMTLVIPGVGGPVVTPAPTPVPTQPPATSRIYVVVYGDTLSGIAAKLGVTVQSLQQYNNISAGTQIFAGQVLAVPPTGGVVYPPQSAPVPVVPRKIYKGYYQVQAGDNLFAIGYEFGVNIYTIAQANGLLNLNQIYTGQWLRIPGR